MTLFQEFVEYEDLMTNSLIHEYNNSNKRFNFEILIVWILKYDNH